MSMQTWFNAMELGRQHNREDEAIQRRNAFASLAQKAYAAPADQRAGIVGKAVGIDPAQGFALQENMQAGEDRQRQQLVNMARLLTSSPVEARSGIYQRIRPGLAQLGINAPATYEENPQLIDQTAQGLIKSAGPAQSANLTPTVQSLVWQRDNGYLDEEGFRTALAIANRQEAGAAPPGYSVVEQWNPQTQQMERVMVQTRGYMPGGGSMAPNIGQPTPQAGGNQQITVYPENIPPSEYNQFLNALPPEARAAASQGGTFANGAQVAPPGVDATSTPQPTMPGGNRVIGASGPSYADQARQAREEARQRAIGGLEGQGPMERETNLRKEFNTEVSNSREILSQYRKVQNTASDTSAAGDLALIFSFMKMLDPGSVVREQEFANAQNAAGVPDRVINLYNNLLRGERLNPTQRQDFLNQAGNIAQDASNSLTNARQFYSRIATEYGLQADRVVRPETNGAPKERTYNPATGRLE